MFLHVQFDNININSLYFSALAMFRYRQSKLHWNRDGAFMLRLCDLNQCCTPAYQEESSMCSACRFHDISANLEYFSLGCFQSRYIYQ